MIDLMSMYASQNADTTLADTEHTGSWAVSAFDQDFNQNDFTNDNDEFTTSFDHDQSFADLSEHPLPIYPQQIHQTIAEPDQYNDSSFTSSEDQGMPSPTPVYRQLSWAQVAQRAPPPPLEQVQQPAQNTNVTSYQTFFQSIEIANPTPSPSPGVWFPDFPQPMNTNRTYAEAAASGINVNNNLSIHLVGTYDNIPSNNAFNHIGNSVIPCSRVGSPLMRGRPAKRLRCDNDDYNFCQAPSLSSNVIVDEAVKSNVNYQLGEANPIQSVLSWNQATKVPGDRLLPRLDTHFQHLHGSSGASPISPSVVSSIRSRRTREEMITSPASHRCKECGAGFESTADLRHHQRNHQPAGERKHKCNECGAAFLHPKDVRRHSKSHNTNPNERFYCPVVKCKAHTKGFNREDHLTRHLKSQHSITDSVIQGSSTPSSQTMSVE